PSSARPAACSITAPPSRASSASRASWDVARRGHDLATACWSSSMAMPARSPCRRCRSRAIAHLPTTNHFDRAWRSRTYVGRAQLVSAHADLAADEALLRRLVFVVVIGLVRIRIVRLVGLVGGQRRAEPGV